MRIRVINSPPLADELRVYLKEGVELDVFKVDEQREDPIGDTDLGRPIRTLYWVVTPAGECALLDSEVELL